MTKKKIIIAGIGGVGGYFGGLSGNQGALRTAFLMRANLTKESFVATGVVIACLIDISRLSVYARQISSLDSPLNYTPIIIATLSAIAGAFIGNKLLKKITIETLQYIVAIMLLIFSLLLGSGIL